MDYDINLTETVSCAMAQDTGTPMQECEFQANYITKTDNSLNDLEVISKSNLKNNARNPGVVHSLTKRII
jgi:hypothetical protein